MKKVVLGALALLFLSQAFAQNKDVVTPKNSWLKAGLAASVPVGDLADYASFAAGLEVSGQYMATPNFGIGVASGYTHYFTKDSYEDFGAIPLGLLLRYYPQSSGFFGGADVGYTFLTNINENNGGFYVKPQIGYHNYSWNLYAFYNQIFRKDAYIDLQNVGIAATYNIRFRK